ncbi:MAG: NERD domain-containing protein [Candidatus Bathyarchaeota archaeon]|nr:MAG: NERD domain-containing protein [Candidatus Bathyarchaeota archaeon]
MRLLKPMGSYLQNKANKYLVLGVVCLVIFLVLLATSIDVLPLYVDVGRYATPRGIALGLLVVGWFYFLLREYPSWRAGIAGERKVIKTLSSALSDEYSIINDIMLKSGVHGNIDHIVVGPTGIFVIETKNHKGRISYYGDNWEGMGRGRPPSSQVRINAMRIKKILDSSEGLKSKAFYIQGVVVFANDKAELIEKKPPGHIKVKRIDELAAYIKSEPKRFNAVEIRQIEMKIQDNIRKHQ